MAITITEGCMQPSKKLLDNVVGDSGAETIRTPETIPFHRHCQKTVLAARGTDGSEGATWSTISDLQLTCDTLRLIKGDWIGLFTDGNNITDDLAAILKLINMLARRLNTSFQLKIQTQDGATIDSNTIQLFNLADTYTFTIGREISLDLDGQTIKFNTAKTLSSDETLTVKFPRSNVSFFVDDEE